MRMLFGLLIAALIFWALAWENKSVMQFADNLWRYVLQAEHFIRYRNGIPLRGTPNLLRLDERLAAAGHKLGAPVFMRIYKKESQLELWMKQGEEYRLFSRYPICAWSGYLGPKLAQGDYQSPEGFYTVARRQLNPNSKYHLSFNLGYPNAFDRVHGRTGDFLMVHGACGSIGCYAVTDPVIDEIWKIITRAFDAGQPRFHVHIMPYRWTAWNARLHAESRWRPFWADLRQGHNHFEATRLPPRVSICKGRYVFEPGKLGEGEHAAIEARCPPGALAAAGR